MKVEIVPSLILSLGLIISAYLLSTSISDLAKATEKTKTVKFTSHGREAIKVELDGDVELMNNGGSGGMLSIEVENR